LVYAALVYCRSRRAGDPHPILREKRAVTLAAGYLFGNLAIFWIYPIKYLYLLPAAFFFLLLAGSTVLTVSRRVAVVFFLSILSFDFVFPAMFEPNIRRHSTGAGVHPALKVGLALEDGLTRTRYIGCSDFPCFSLRWTQAGEELPDR